MTSEAHGTTIGKPLLSLLATLVCLLLGMTLSVSIGSWSISLSQIGEILGHVLSGGVIDPTDPTGTIVWFGRVPRTLCGALVGFSLGCAGVVMQGVFKNPMASPGIIGTSSGAALGAVTALYFGLAATSLYLVPLLAVTMAFVSLMVVLAVATSGGLTSRYTLLLGGIAFNAIFTAITSVVIVLSTEQYDMARKIVSWLMGDLTNRSWEHVIIIAVIALVGFIGSLLYARDLNILMISEEQARNFGVRVNWSRNILLVFSALLTGGAVAVAGGIGFVGLIAPHMMRSLVGSDNRLLLPAAGLLGGALVVYADCLVRLVGSGGLRIGVLTALLGGPFFLFLIIRDRKKYVYF
nr:iron ABC transporter permease [uncultured Desulfuromonas sp.]